MQGSALRGGKRFPSRKEKVAREKEQISSGIAKCSETARRRAR